MLLKKPKDEASLLASKSTVKQENSLAAGVAAMAFSAKTTANTFIAGRILNKDSLPVVNAEIKINSDSTVITDKNGDFTINTNDSLLATTISAMGYKTINTELVKGEYNSIVLKDRPFLLSQVPVTYLNSKKRSIAKDSTASMPEGGWRSFQEYVYKKLHKNYDTTNYADDEGEVELEFSINEKGDPYNFKILRSTNDALTSRTIDAIREGPKWISGNAAKTSRIKLHY